MNTQQIEHRAMIGTLDFLISEFDGLADHKTARQSLIAYRTRLELEGDVYRLRTKTVFEHIRSCRVWEWLSGVLIVSMPVLMIWWYFILTGNQLQF